MRKALALISGGLDSILAAYLVKRQPAVRRVEVLGIHFVHIFARYRPKNGIRFPPARLAGAIGIPLKLVNFSRDLLELVKSPSHGYGSRLNPCIDCHARMLQRAKEYLQEVGASFLITGEVIGQRPMSQRAQAINIIEREAGLEGLILRPLSAKRLPLTIPEKEGWVNRDELMGLKGRGRRRQIRLAKEELHLDEIPSPAGGCLLTDPAFTLRLDDLLASNPDPTLMAVHLLKVGRHFRLDDQTKAVVGRNERDNASITTHAREGDLLLELEHVMGPTTLLLGNTSPENVRTAAAITARYADAPATEPAAVRVFPPRRRGEGYLIQVIPATQERVDDLIIAPLPI